MRTRVALYVRVSTEEQAEQGYSIPAQTEVLTQYAETQGWEVTALYADEGISAKNMNRPALQRMLREIEQGTVDIVLIWKASRLTRRLRDLTTMLDAFNQYNVALVSITEKFDLSTATGRAMLQIAGVFAELERNNLAENVRLGQKRKAREGGWNGGRIFGYDCTPLGLVVNTAEAETVRRMYEWYVAGKGYLTICNLLNAEGVPTKRGSQWYVQGVLTILENPVYKGYVRYGVMNDWAEKGRKGKIDNPILAKGKHEPVISEGLWERAQAERAQRSSYTSHRVGHYILSGLLRCPACGSRMVGWHTKRSGRLFRYYKCGAFNSKGKMVCKGNYVNADKAEVLARLSRVLPDQALITDLVGRLNDDLAGKTQPLRDQLAGLDQQILKTKQQMMNLVQAVESGTLDGTIVRDRMNEHNKALSALDARRSHLEQELRNATQGDVSADLVMDSLSRFHETISFADPDLQKRLLGALIDRVSVTSERVVDQVFLAFDPLSLLYLLDAETTAASSVTFIYDTVHPG